MKFTNTLYDYKQILRYVIIFLLLIVISNFTKGWIGILLIYMMIYSIIHKKTEILLFILLTTACFAVTNGKIFRKGTVFNIYSKSLFICTSLMLISQSIWHEKSRYLLPLLSILPYIVFIIVPSIIGWNPIISSLKLFLFISTYFAFYGSSIFVISNKSNICQIRSMVLAITCIYILGSIFLIPFPSISNMRAEELINNSNVFTLFKGMANHSQALGPLVTIIGIFVYADMVFSLQKMDFLYIILLLCCCILIYMTSSRTAMASFICGITFVSLCTINNNSINTLWVRKILLSILFCILCFSLLIVCSPLIRRRIVKFTVKYNISNNTSLTTANLWQSRESKLERALYNWQKSPYIGNGFQVSEDMEGLQIKNIRQVLSAPVEKSTWTHAILEEGGMIGISLFVIFIVVSIVLLLKRSGFISASLIFTFIVSNMGEFTIFSMSGEGGILWLMIFIGAIIDHMKFEKSTILQDINVQ